MKRHLKIGLSASGQFQGGQGAAAFVKFLAPVAPKNLKIRPLLAKIFMQVSYKTSYWEATLSPQMKVPPS